MHITRTHRLGRWGGVTLALAVALTLSLVSAAPATVRADGDDGCDAAEAVVCIPLPEEQPGAAPQAPNTAAAAAPLPPGATIPPGICPPLKYPQPISFADTPVAAAAAAPLPPVPPGCSFRSIIATINGANVAYARAMRTLDTSVLTPFWSGQALADMIDQVRTLRAYNSYATPQLRAIWPVEIVPGGATARVRTNENWLYQMRDRSSGALIFEQDQWVENIYDLAFRGNGWTITRDVITLMSAPPIPVPPSPPQPAPGPVVSVRVTTDRDSYAVGDSIAGTIVNDGNVTLYGGGGYACGLLEVERLTANGWEKVPNPPTFAICTAIAIGVSPGASRTETLTAGAGTGAFRLAFRYSGDQGVSGTAYSAPYIVH